MFAFQSPFITTLHTSRPLFLPHRQFYHPLQINSANLVRLPVRCAFDDTIDDDSSVSETQSYPLLSQATIVTVQLPLDVYLEETTDGRIFIDELVPGGSAQVSGLLREGDIIVAISLPFGDGLVPVPKTEALEMITSHTETREDDGFRLAVLRTEPVQHLRSQTADNRKNSSSIAKILPLMQQIHIPEYPIRPPNQDDVSTSEAKFLQDLAALREDGFDVDDMLGAPEET